MTQFDEVVQDIRCRVESDSQLLESVEKFVNTYKKLSKKGSNAYLVSAFHKFGWVFGGTISRNCGGMIRQGKRIPIQVKSAGWRKLSRRGKARATLGRPPLGAQSKANSRLSDAFLMPGRKTNSSIKRPHSLKQNIQKGQQNSGKW